MPVSSAESAMKFQSRISAAPTILLVDDTESSRYVLSRVVSREYNVLEADRGGRALALARAECPEIVILDVNLPDIAGDEVCRRLKTDPATGDIQVLMISALLTADDDRVRGLDAGADAYLAQPVDPDVLLATVRALKRSYDAIKREKSARQELRTANDQLRRSNEDLQRFAYVASHDLQEPLRMIGSYCQLLGLRYSTTFDDDAREYFSFIIGGVERMRSLIRDLLLYSRVVTAESTEAVTTDCSLVVDWALMNLQTAIHESGATITRSDLPTVIADDGQLLQVFQNLIGNAIKYRKPGEPPRIHIAADPDEEMWTFSVTDNGIGFDMQFADRIFGAFQRLHGQEFEGTGIGLAICKRIIERIGGSIWARSTPGQGTTFYFTLPRSVD
jgi:signal transduction histidine kinase